MRFHFHLPKFISISKRKRLFLFIVLVSVLIISGTLFTLFKLGKIGTRADSLVKTVIYSGLVTDTSGKPIPGVTVSSGNSNGKATVITTDVKGAYKATITVDLSHPEQSMAVVQFTKDGYLRANSDYITHTVLVTDNPVNNISQNFVLIPQSVAPQPKSAATGRSAPSAQSVNPVNMASLCSYKRDYAELINGVLFCTNYEAVFKDHYDDIVKNAQQAALVRNQVGLVKMPQFYLVPNKDPLITDPKKFGGQSACGATYVYGFTKFAGDPVVALNYGCLNSVGTITHELGHVLDYSKSFHVNESANLNPGCYKVEQTDKTLECPSSANHDFRSAFFMAGNKLISGYALDNSQEMFAEMFEALLKPDSNFVKRDKIIYTLTNFKLADYDLGMDDNFNSTISACSNGDLSAQNAGIYIYKFVAASSKLEEYFPGTIDHTLSYEKIHDGKYMSVGIVPVKAIDFQSGMIYGAKVAIGSSSDVTRSFNGKAFSDNHADMFDTTGTIVLKNVSTGNQVANMPKIPDYLNGAVYLPSKIQILPGANNVQSISFDMYRSGPFSFNNGKDSPANGLKTGPAIGATGGISLINPFAPAPTFGENPKPSLYPPFPITPPGMGCWRYDNGYIKVACDSTFKANCSVCQPIKGKGNCGMCVRLPLETPAGETPGYSTQSTTSSTKDISPIAKNQMSRYPDFGTVNGKVDADEKNGYLYWVIGGDRTTKINETYTFSNTEIGNNATITNSNTVGSIGCGGNSSIFTFYPTKFKRNFKACH